MDFLELKNISERYLELLNPTTPDKVLSLGEAAGMREGSRVIDFGCGYGEALALWAERFSIGGTGIDIRPYACERARQKLAQRGLAERVAIVCADAAAYTFEAHAYDVAACIGATFIWGDLAAALRHMKEAIAPEGRLVVGEAHWRSERMPPVYAQSQPAFQSEYGLLETARREGFEFEYLLRSSEEDWDRYEASNWRGLVAWLKENPTHPNHAEVVAHLRDSQDEYLRYGREHLGWALYLLTPLR